MDEKHLQDRIESLFTKARSNIEIAIREKLTELKAEIYESLSGVTEKDSATNKDIYTQGWNECLQQVKELGLLK